jgi:Do/DeqQ family serine protease
VCTLAGVLALGGCGNEDHSGRGSPAPVVVERSDLVRSPGTTAMTPTSYAPIIEKVAPSVVSVYSTKSIRGRVLNPLLESPLLRRFFGPDEGDGEGRARQEASLGSGVVVSKDGFILTNNHVVEGADEIRVSMTDGREFAAQVIGVDPGTDTAVLRVKGDNLPTAVLTDSSKIRVGDLAFAIGNPFGVGQTVTMGIVSATERTGFGITEYEDFIQTDAAVNPGNSGGPLIDAEGRVMGINTAILSRSGGYQGIGFAVPINLARFTMEQIIQHGRVIRGYLGVYIQPLTPQLGRALHLPDKNGAVIAGVGRSSPAAKAGLKSGDVIVGINGKKIVATPELRLAIAQLTPGSTAQLDVVRDGHPLQLPIKVGELPRRAQPAPGQG